jgi:hypothetical protein
VSCSTRWERLREEPWCACMESKVVLKLLIVSATLCCYFARVRVSEQRGERVLNCAGKQKRGTSESNSLVALSEGAA